MPVIGGEVLGKNIIKFTKGFLKAVDSDMAKIATLLQKAVKVNTGLTDHDQSDLTEMGHPYSRKSGGGIHDPDWLVHKQSGRLQRAIYKGVIEASVTDGELNATAFVGVDDGQVPYALYVVYGTNKMIPRNFLIGSLNDISYDAREILKRSLNQMVVSFNGEKVKL